MNTSAGLLGGYRGARWLRVDFHLHTPGVPTFSGVSGLDPRNPQHRDELVNRYVQRLVDEGIQVAALTDYNGVRVDWFTAIRERASERGIVVLPGVELCFETGKYGLHVLVVLAQDTDLRSVDLAIHALDRAPSEPLVREDGTHRPIVPVRPLPDVLGEIRRQFNAIVILAHPTSRTGFARTFDAAAAASLLREASPDAIERLEDNEKARLVDTGQLRQDFFERLACVEFSDPKALDEIGYKRRPDGTMRATYLKLTTTQDLDAIRLALHDPQVRVCCGEPPDLEYTKILSVSVSGSGFLGGWGVPLSPELNTLIGGRGVGKSALLEAIRYALDLPVYEATRYRLELVRHALGSGGKVTVQLQRMVAPRVRRMYRIERILGDRPRVFEISEDGTEVEVQLTPLGLFSEGDAPLCFGQRELYEVTRNDQNRLVLIDELIGRAAREAEAKIKRVQEELGRNAYELADLTRRVEEKEDTERRLREIEHEIEIYRREGLVEKLREAILLSQDEERLKRMKSSVEQAFSLWSASKERLQSQLMQGLILAGQAESVNKAILQKAADEITGLRDRLMGLVSEGEEHFRTAISALSALAVRWGQERQTVDEVIERVKQELGVHRLDPERLDELVREQTRLRGRLQEVEAFERDKEAKLRIRRGLLRQYRDIRHDIFELRRSEAEEITKKIGGSVKVRVDYKGQTEAFVDRLVSFFQGSGVDRKTLEGICHREGRNVDGQAIAEAAEKGAAELEKQFGLTPARANQVASWLNAQPERLFELQLLSPDDRVDILMTVDGSDLPLEWLSGGQRATAMLLLILAQADRLLIIDQPEDDLDNRFIYEDIVKILRGAKAKRQIVVATHNPNIPVLGDAELIVAMDVREGKAGILAQGAVDLLEVRDAVKRIMEGGEDAFRRRAEKYGWYIEDRPT